MASASEGISDVYIGRVYCWDTYIYSGAAFSLIVGDKAFF